MLTFWLSSRCKECIIVRMCLCIYIYVSFYLNVCKLSSDKVSQFEQYWWHCVQQKTATGRQSESWDCGIICTAHKASHRVRTSTKWSILHVVQTGEAALCEASGSAEWKDVLPQPVCGASKWFLYWHCQCSGDPQHRHGQSCSSPSAGQAVSSCTRIFGPPFSPYGSSASAAGAKHCSGVLWTADNERHPPHPPAALPVPEAEGYQVTKTAWIKEMWRCDVEQILCDVLKDCSALEMKAWQFLETLQNTGILT